jgi:hypothetical protein
MRTSRADPYLRNGLVGLPAGLLAVVFFIFESVCVAHDARQRVRWRLFAAAPSWSHRDRGSENKWSSVWNKLGQGRCVSTGDPPGSFKAIAGLAAMMSR